MSSIVVDTARCVGAAQCVLAAPDLFDQDDAGTVVVLAQPDDSTSAAAVVAVDLCPSKALALSKD